jgi:hypothetical protein
VSFISENEWRQVPVRLDAERWTSRPGCRKVLVVVHTVTSGQRLLDAVRLLDGDLRVQVMFTMAPDVFSNGVQEFLASLRGVVLPWHQAVETRFALALAAGYEGVHQLHAPVIVLPHGAGYNKFVVDGRNPRPGHELDVYGLSRQWLMRDGAVVPAAVVLSHREDLARLGRMCPEALPVATVVGDSCYDCIRASLPQRALYRAALGIRPDQQFVLATSTWGPHSLLAQAHGLLDRLMFELPREEYRVALLLHPNAWNAHGEWQIRSWLAGLRRAGLALVSQHSDWRGVLVAADRIVGDHGSMSLYGAAAGVPVQMAGFPVGDVDPSSPMGELGSLAPRLALDRPLRRQLAGTSAAAGPDDYLRVAARISSEPGRFARNMRDLMYRKLRLRQAAGSRNPVTEPAGLPVLVRDQPDRVMGL